MDYLLHGNPVALRNLVILFQRACKVQGIQIHETTGTRILIKWIADAKERGLLEEVKEGATSKDGYRNVEDYLKRHNIPHVKAEVMAFDILSMLKVQEASDET